MAEGTLGYVELVEQLKIGVRACRLARSKILECSSTRKVDSAIHRDIKLEADRLSNQSVLDFLKEHSSFGVASEESEAVRGESDQYRWVLDPLDGSFNFFRGLPFCAVSIGLWGAEGPLLGAVLDVPGGALYTGIVSVGAWKDGQPLRVSQTECAEQAIICTGFPVAGDFRSEALVAHVELMRDYKKVRMFGSAALSLAYVAAGMADAYFENGIRLWDVAAGVALVKAAGGEVALSSTLVEVPLKVFASNGRLKGRGPASQFSQSGESTQCFSI